MQDNFKKVQPPSQPASKPTPPTTEKLEVSFVPVSPDDAVKGNDKALVTVVVFSDFQCPYCNKAKTTTTKLVKKFGKQVRWVFKHNPLPFHKNALDAAKASLVAKKYGKFWKMHDVLLSLIHI